MVLSNGAAWTVSPSNKGTRSNTNTTSNFMYGDDSTPTGTTIKYYLNDVLKYTSTVVSATVYPQIQSYIKDSVVSINADWVSSKSITFTVDDYNTQPSLGQTIGLGFDASQSKQDWDQLDFSFTAFSGSVDPTDVTVRVQESGSIKWTDTMTPVNGDTFKIVLSGLSEGGTRLPPPPLIARF